MTDDGEGLVTLATFARAPEAGMVCELLSNSGIPCVLQGANYGALEPLPLIGGFSEIRLLVQRQDYQRAKDAYEAFFAGDAPQMDEGDPR